MSQVFATRAKSLIVRAVALICGILAPLVWSPVASAAAPSCESFGNGTRIGSSTIVLAQPVAGGDVTGMDGTRVKDVPAFCRIFAVASPEPSSRILIEIWMPEPGKWNGKILGTGNGGAAGKVSTAALAGGVRRGFATATTDMGSYPAGLPGIGFNFGDGRPEAIRDWAYRSTHEMTLLAKDVVLRYYGRAASKAYFIGCSTGGHQALMEAQKYPEDYDGIIAGAPAHNRTHLHTRFAALRQLGLQPGAALPTPLMKAWTGAILKACAGRDGGAPSDTFLTNPLQCTVSPRQLACKPNETSGTCLSDVQVKAIEQIYSGTRNPRTGQLIYFPDVRGAEDQISLVYGDGFFAGNFDITHWILPPERSFKSFDFDADMAALDDRYAVEVNAMNPDLSRFAARGGKLIMFHGWQDGLISPIDSIDYFQRIRADGRAATDFTRLFMVPGLQHCFGGPGGSIGQAAEFGPSPDATPDDDLLLALDRWSEGGAGPDMMTATRMSVPADAAKAAGTAPGLGQRQVCAFPRIARYNGKGNPYLASGFTCTKGPASKYERPAAQYLR